MDPNAYSKFHAFTTPAIAPLSFNATTGHHTPFRARTHHRHATWARTSFSRPELYLQPRSIPELRLIVDLARKLSKQLVVVGSRHSPSNLTCGTSWMVNLDDFASVVGEEEESRTITVQAGMRLRDLIKELEGRGWAMPNLGSITDQSIAGAIATSTHGSSLKHGILSESVVALTLMLASGRVVECSRERNVDLFRAALVSLGAIGIVVEVAFQAVEEYKVRWEQEVVKLPRFLKSYDSVWDESEFVRCWWFPYSERTIVWHGKKVQEEIQSPPKSWYGASFGRYTYETLLYLATWFPRVMPYVERFVFKMQYGLEEGLAGSAVQNSHQALTMDCLFSQFVNEVRPPYQILHDMANSGNSGRSPSTKAPKPSPVLSTGSTAAPNSPASPSPPQASSCMRPSNCASPTPATPPTLAPTWTNPFQTGQPSTSMRRSTAPS